MTDNIDFLFDLNVPEKKEEIKEVQLKEPTIELQKENFNLEVKEEEVPLFEKSDKYPSLYDINNAFDVIESTDGRYKGIKGEYKCRLALFTNFVLGRKCNLLKGQRSSGKTNLISCISVFCPRPIIISAASDKAHFNDTINYNDATHFIVPEINKVNDNFVEVLKDIGEGAPSIYDKTLPGGGVSKIKIDPKPFVTSIADENKNTDRLGEELVSRLTVLDTDSSVNQNIAVIEEKLKRAQNPYEKRKINKTEVNTFISYVKSLIPIDKLKFIYLPGNSIRKAIPPLFTDSRRDTDKYLDNTYGITLFHLHDRITFDYKKKKHVLVTPLDVWYNHIIFGEVLLKSALKCNPTEKLIIKFLKEENTEKDHIGMTVKEVHNRLSKEGIVPSFTTVKKYCDHLYEIGYVLLNDNVKPNTYEINPIMDKQYILEIDWGVIVKECAEKVRQLFPEYADEYIKRFCGNEIMATHPFTGETINILKYKETDKPAKKEETEVKSLINTDAKIANEKVIQMTGEVIMEDETQKLRNSILDILSHSVLFSNDIMGKLIDEYPQLTEEKLQKELNFLRNIGELYCKNNKYSKL